MLSVLRFNVRQLLGSTAWFALAAVPLSLPPASNLLVLWWLAAPGFFMAGFGNLLGGWRGALLAITIWWAFIAALTLFGIAFVVTLFGL
jgi:hypothetical protein